MNRILLSLFFLFVLQSCKTIAQNTTNTSVIVGAEQKDLYLPYLKDKNIALVVNQTSTIGNEHLVDFLFNEDVKIKKVFAPEHGFRGEASAGDEIANEIDKKTKLPILSLHGKSKKPSVEQLADVDIVVFDIQDVGVRFYTYISTLYYVMQACAENNKELVILDRPNPNGHYVAGPILEEKFKSFVGIAPIPVVHGCTIGELAQLYNGEKMLGAGLMCKLKVILVKNYTHSTVYDLPVKPSPNLPNRQSILLYPSICLFEPTKISVGRGTDKQFQVIGGPDKNLGNYIFRPIDKPGAINPPNENVQCFGADLSLVDAYNQPFSLDYFISYYQKFQDKSNFFTNERFFNLLIGNDWVLKEIRANKSAIEIEKMWEADLAKFKETRKKYLLYN